MLYVDGDQRPRFLHSMITLWHVNSDLVYSNIAGNID